MRKLAGTRERGESLFSLVALTAFTLLMAVVAVRLALAGEWVSASIAAVVAAAVGLAVAYWYRRLPS